MKNNRIKLLLVILQTFVVGTSQGQNQPNSLLFEIQQNSIVEHTLTRIHADKMLFYVRSTTENYFAINTVGQQAAQRALIPMNYEIADMELLNDTLYFCGYDNIQSRGFIGQISISSFLFGNSPYIIHTNFYYTNKLIKDIRRLCVYAHPATNHPCIVAIGDSNVRNCVIVIYNALSNRTTWNYTIGITNLFEEKFNEITVTEDYVVTAGYLNNKKHIALRALDKNNIFTSSFGDTVYPFYSYGMGKWIDYGYDDCQLSALEQNYVATYSTMRITDTLQTPPTERNGLLLNIYNIGNMIGSTSYSPIHSSAMRHKDNTGNAKVQALCYDQINDKLLGLAHYYGLQPSMTATENSWITEMNLNNLTANFLTHFSYQHHFEDVTMNATYDRLFTIGYDVQSPQNLILMTNIYDSTGCEANIPIAHNDFYQLAAKEELSAFSTYTGSTTRIQASPIRRNQIQITYPCIRR